MTDCKILSNCGQKRKYNLDLLRILSMVMIVCLHLGSHGGMVQKYSVLTKHGVFFHFLTACCMVGVNLFVLISGYFLSVQRFRPSRIIKLEIEILFYSYVITYILVTFKVCPIQPKNLIPCILPVIYGQYWFVSAYMAMYLLSPYMNMLVNTMSKKQYQSLLLLLLLSTSILYDLFPRNSFMPVSSGYNFFWFIVLYFIAGYLRKHVTLCSGKIYMCVYSLCSILLLLTEMILRFGISKIGFAECCSATRYYYRYNSVLVICASIALFLAFSCIEIHSKCLKGIIKFVAPLTFGVYLIHDNPNMRVFLWQKVLNTPSWEINRYLPIKAVVAVLTIFVVCICIDFVRKVLFECLSKVFSMDSKLKGVDEAFNAMFVSDKS